MNNEKKDLKILAENRDILLAAEIAALLHMIGKYHEDFINRTQPNMDIKVPDEIKNNSIFSDDLTNGLAKKVPTKWLNNNFGDKRIIIGEFIETHKKTGKKCVLKNPYLCLNADAHGRGSGTEKGILDNSAYEYQKDGTTRIYISTTFGFEKCLDIINISTERLKLYRFLPQKIQELIGNNTKDLKYRSDLRQEFIRTLQQHFNNAIGDTRRPINDVTLWDQTISSVAFFKAELAEALVNGYKDPFIKNRKYTFRYLHITFNGEEYLAKGISIGDIASRRKLIDEAFDKVKLIIEVEYPLGLEIYRDLNGITFLIPELSEKLGIDDLIIDDDTLKGKILKEVITITQSEITPYFYISEKSSRNLYNLGSMISKKPDTSFPSPDLEDHWTQKAEICSSCRIKPVDSDSERNKQKKRLCKECSNRITHRAKQWFDNRKEQTIWIDEIADTNGKIALLSIGFNLNNWINSADNLSTFRNLKNDIDFSFAELERELSTLKDQRELSTLKDQSNMQHLKSIVNKRVLNDLKKFDKLYDFMVDSEDLGVNEKLGESEKLALSIWRKPPSFARVRRVWETTSKFWSEALADIRQIVGVRNQRLVLKMKIPATNLGDLNVNNAYEAKVNGTRFTVFYKSSKEDANESNNPKDANFVIIENLELLAKKLNIDTKCNWENLVDCIKKELKGKNIDLYNSNNPTKKLIDSRIKCFEIESCNYSPVIEITKDPERFMVLVPANKALEVARKIKRKYEEEMGKVRNRLSMNLGIVYAGYHTALPSVIDAGRRLMKMKNTEKPWTLVKQPEEYSNEYKLTFNNGKFWEIPSKMGDCSEDIWYPYFYVVNKDKEELKNRSLSFKGPSGNWLIHVSQLKEGDKVLVIPSYFDFEYLSSASQRFEISYNDEGKRRSRDRKQRPYYLDDIDEFEKAWVTLSTKLSNRQIKKLNSLVEKKRRDWADSLEENVEPFKNYIVSIVDNLKWKQPLLNDERNRIIEFCVNGILSDVLEIYMSIMKEKSEVAE